MADSASTSSTYNYACTRCPKTYKRREHLQRHALTHIALLPHRCVLCGSAYSRADVLKRHVQTCEARALAGGGPPKRRACDRCVQMKKACNTKRPCDTCRARGAKCQYSFRADADADEEGISSSVETASIVAVTDETSETAETVEAIGPADPTATMWFGRAAPSALALPTLPVLDPDNGAAWLDFLNLSATDGDGMPLLPDLELAPPPALPSLHFLDNFTKKTGLINSFECGSPRQREQVMSSIARYAAANAATNTITHPGPGTPAATLPLATQLGDASSTVSVSVGHAGSVAMTTALQDPLIAKTHQIVLRIREVVTVKPRNSTVALDWSVAVEQQCLQFFSPSNLSKFLALYWALWHPNVNHVHRPSFDPADSKCVLVAAMTLLGACMSSDAEDNRNARMWFNCVEEIVFIDDDFSCNLQTQPALGRSSTVPPVLFDPASQKRTIQVLQASYIVCLYQNWEGSDESKQRIRRYRFSTVVSVARDIGIQSARHADYATTSPHEFDWKGFVAREQLIRTFIWIYLLDQAFVIFNNLPPRMMIKEMHMHLAWPESTFQAGSAAVCGRAAREWLQQPLPVHGMTLREATEIICTSAITPAACRTLANMGPLNLFAIVSALHFLIFQKQNSFGGEDQLHAIRTGLDNWKRIWESYSSDFADRPPHATIVVQSAADGSSVAPDDMWRRTGFMRHSPEYWLLAHLVINRLSAAGSDSRSARLLSRGLGLYSVDSTARASAEDTTGDPLLTKYDETSMRQVNDLISQFQGIQL